MRILLLTTDPIAPGVLQSLAALGVEPVVAVPSGESVARGAVRFERVTARGEQGDPLHLRWSRKALRTVVRDLRPDLIHLGGDPWTPTAESGAAAARYLKTPYVLVGSSSLGGPRGITARWQARRVRDGAAGLAGVSRPALAWLSDGRHDVPEAIVPHLGFEIPSEVPTDRPPASVTFVVVGRIVPERGLDLLLDALANCFGDWRLKIVGTGPAQESLEHQAQRLGLSARLEWLGGLPRGELWRVWPEVDMIVAPSRSTVQWVEPTGSLVLEAMANGRGAIVSRSGALPEVVGEDGLIVDENDRDALQRALAGVISDPGRTRQIGAAARRRVLEHYGDAPTAERILGWWRAALGQTSQDVSP